MAAGAFAEDDGGDVFAENGIFLRRKRGGQ
jgi:hypothetical protein